MRLFSDESGGALVEFAAFLSMLVLLFVGMVDYALEIQQAMQVTEAASAGASFGSIPGNQKNLSGIEAAATNSASGVHGFTVTAVDVFICPGPPVVSASISTTCTGYGKPIEYVQVNTSATVPPLMAYIGMPSSLKLNGSASFRVPWTP